MLISCKQLWFLLISSARDSGITSDKREEGMFVFLKDTNEFNFMTDLLLWILLVRVT